MEWNIEQLSFAVKEPLKHVKVSICQQCNICKYCKQSSAMMVATEESVLYPVVVVKEYNITCRPLLDNGTGSSYESSALLEKNGNIAS